ncbi:hypothetical protein SAMN05444411_1148 [Lutibacter oricola]|uniref:Right handed beta helix region n=1 Tax=Lutibacter oricola TaxID=762486 RepID=A0A1H3GGN3_9FLAO|nr:hypothetical protein [Lutibacter oricola]SDY01664.1 hypothetical protein SAMN05444411_1148 [Lutibacter oricola]
MRNNITLVLILFVVVFSSCRKDFDTVLSSGKLAFSKDTVYLDTVFTNIGSSTYNLKVYNKSSKAISIPTLGLKKGESSFYRLNVDGIAGKTFENVEIRAKDSMYIFIETTIDYSQITDPIYTDAIVFDSGNNLQDVKLITLVEDAYFLYPSKNAEGVIETIKTGIDGEGNDLRIQGFYLEGNTTFTNEKPYVIYGYYAVPENNTLTIDAGAKIHFHSNSGLIVNKNSSLLINGKIDSKVTFEGDRLEPSFSDIPGQWGAIWLRAGSKNNSIKNTVIKNASIGIIMDSIGSNTTPTLTLKNTEIYNSSNYGLLARETNVKGDNVIINNSGQVSLACIIGGTYNFTHSTFTNYWNNSLREYPSVLINNYYTYQNGETQIVQTRDLVAANFTNCIIDGNRGIEFLVEKVEGSLFNFNFKNNLIRFNDYNNSYTAIAEYNFEDSTHYSNNILNGEADFKNPNNNELIIGKNNEGIGKALPEGTTESPIDVLGVTRANPADIGAYEHTIFEEED